MIFFEASEYQDKVNILFEKVRSLLLKELPGLRIEHIGASSVPGAVSKGDLDVLVGVAQYDFYNIRLALEKLGFQEKLNTLRTENLCMLFTEEFNHDVAIQLIVNGSEFENFITFRELLRSNKTILDKYNEIKRGASILGEDEYRALKSKWVEEILSK
jgi:GrpB-like predicted nucleotidyltransferase (UPF0157 family)